MAWVVLVFLWVLGRTLLQRVHPRFFFGVKRLPSDGKEHLLFNLNFNVL